MAYETYKKEEFDYETYKLAAESSKADIKDINERIYDFVSSDPDLNGVNSLTNPSRTSIYSLWINIVAFVMWLLKIEWIRYETALIERARTVIPHTLAWYAQRAKEFQYGDTLVTVNGAINYPTINTAVQIIKGSAVKETNGLVFIKVAKLSGINLVALSNTELLAFEGYINAIKDAGVRTQVVSQNADVLKLQATVYYNPIIPLTTIKADAENAIGALLRNLSFDGVLSKNAIIDAIQAVAGAVDVKITALEASVAYTGAPLFLPIDVWYETVAGYINIDPAYPLSTNLTFAPYV